VKKSDRKLLDAAARAAKLDVCWFTQRDVGYLDDIYEDIPPKEQRMHFRGTQRTWNPLADDGDALRLAVALGINIDFGFAATAISATHYDWGEEEEDVNIQESGREDRHAGTRRAIVRAAAAMAGVAA
jgi:hypothetical protein